MSSDIVNSILEYMTDYKSIFLGVQWLYNYHAWLLFLIPLALYLFSRMSSYHWFKLLALYILQSIAYYIAYTVDTELISNHTNHVDIIIAINVLIYLYSTLTLKFIWFRIVFVSYTRDGFLYDIEVIWDFFIATLLKVKTHFTNYKRTPQVQKTVTPVQQQFQTQTKKKQLIGNLPAVQSSKQPKNNTHSSKNLLLPKPKELIFTNNGKKVYTEAGYTYTLQKQIGFGGEGTVHIISKQQLAKIFHQDKATNEKLKKLQKFLSMRKIASVVFPEKILYDKNKKFIGYTMPQVFGVKELGVLHSKKNRERYCPNWNYIDLLDLSLAIANTLQKLHDARIIVADFNPRNVLVRSPKKIYFIDIDSYQVERQPSTVGIMMYTRPIHIKKSHKEYLKNRSDDLYALSMMIFQNLTSGGNPYTTQQGGTEEELIKRHEFAFNVKEPHKSNANSALINAWSQLSIELRKFFEDVFRYQKPVLLSTLTQALKAHKRSLMRVQTKTRSK